MNSPTLILVTFAIWLTSASAQSVFINELHYDNASNDANEGVEIAGPAGTNLTAYKLVFYNGSNRRLYGELPLGGTIPAQNGTAFGTAFFSRAPIQNGAPDGLALIDTVANSVVQFLSYEGSFTAIDGDAIGEISTDIGVREGNGSVNNSLQLTGSGAVYSDFAWQSPSPASPNMINSGQTFIGAGNPSITLTLMPSTLSEGTSTTATLALFPPPAETVTVSIQNSDTSELSAPLRVSVPTSGSTTFTVGAIDDLINDGTQSATLTASAPIYDPGSATALVQDIQAAVRGTGIRLATINTLNGVGSRNSPEYEALRTLIERLEPDIIGFQEVARTSDFFDLRNLVEDLGFPHLATTDDDFAGQAYVGGEFSTSQNVAIASRFPITSATQIERGATGRKEMTRYPLMVEIDVPNTDNDPVVVVVHYKASQDDASRYRKAIEGYRTVAAILAAGHDPTTDNIFVIGDFNEDHDRFMPNFYNTGNTNFNDNTNLPASFQLGADLSGINATSIPYAQFPDKFFGDNNFITPQHRQQDGIGERTFINLGDAALDYIVHSQFAAGNAEPKTEIYNSALDDAYDGLVKQASPAPASTSFKASDHFALIGDYELDPKLALSLNISPSKVSENAGSATGTLTLSQPPTAETVIRLSTERSDSPIHLPVPVLTFAAGETQKTFPIDVIDRPSADTDRTITIAASATGYARACDTLLVYNLEPSGRILISQYIESATGSAPRGLELFNCGTEDINLFHEPIHVVQYTNGSNNGSITARAEIGLLPAGKVVVVGGTTIGNYLVSQGLIPTPVPPLDSAPTGTAYANGAGEVVFIKDPLQFSGDDALEIQFAFGLSDVFGNIGEDPGSAWQSNGVSTAAQNLSILEDLATPSVGFTQPHLRFSNTAPGDDPIGFGIPPAANDPFKLWLRSFGLEDPQADPDSDGIPNLLEYATGSDPTDSTSANPPVIETATISHRQLTAPGRLTYRIESSTDLEQWGNANLSQTGSTQNGDGTETVSFQASPDTREFLRLKVTLD
ncbi:MAG: endonuclease/exonuclease/phosphatase family metal-dependent hydrolase [Verrucomicrobiales bacterium]|jgi:endonuclease/exonuclease/phosphatase family metal-dependent hydrolase